MFEELGLQSRELCSVVERALRNVTPPDASFSVIAADAVMRPNPITDRERAVVLVRVTAVQPAVVQGTYLPVTPDHGRGFTESYVYGAVHGHYMARYGRDLISEIELVLDIQAGPRSQPPPPIYRLIPVEQARDLGLLLKDSPLDSALIRYAISFVPLAGDVLSGPSLAMMETVADHAPDGGRMLDLFAGSCTLTRVALQHGLSSAVAIDSELDAGGARSNLGEYADRCDLLRADIADGIPEGGFDLIVLDPYYDHTLVAIVAVAPLIRGFSATVLINLGVDLPTAWQARIREKVHQLLGPAEIETRRGECVAICRPTR